MILRRREQQLSDEYLSQLIADDPIGRNADLKSFISMLDEVEGGFAFFIDGKWGSGKTVFVKQVILTLKCLQGTFQEALDEKITVNIGKGFIYFDTIKTRFLPIYYNAWENDVFADSTVTLLGTLVSEFGDDYFAKEQSELSDKVVSLIDAFMKPFGLDVASGLRDGFTAEDLLSSMKEIKAVQSNVCDVVSALLEEERADKLILFVDELDRCSPAFALQLIERIKFILTMDNVIVVSSTDVSQLTHTVEGYYGKDFDGGRYLTRYYDLKLTLKDIPPSAFLAGLGFKESLNYFDKITLEMANHYALSMRDCIRYLQEIDAVRDRALRETGSDFGDMATLLLKGGLVPVLFAIKVNNGILYNQILSGQAGLGLLNEAKASSTFMKYLEKCFNSHNGQAGEKYQFDTTESFFMKTYEEAFCYKHPNRIPAAPGSAFAFDSPKQLVREFFDIGRLTTN